MLAAKFDSLKYIFKITLALKKGILPMLQHKTPFVYISSVTGLFLEASKLVNILYTQGRCNRLLAAKYNLIYTLEWDS